MKLIRSRGIWTAAALVLSLLVLPSVAGAQSAEGAPETFGRTYRVTVTNLTKGQIISPPVVYSHRGRFKLFTPGEEAIPELAGLAEDADSADLLALLGVEPGVADVNIADDGVPPGHSIDIEIEVPWRYRHISALGMLVTTNDAFFAASSYVPFLGTSTYAQAWDAGSEANTQDCDHIPGPPCGSGGVRVEDGAEGYIYIHAGIQDRGSLYPAEHDWRNPVAKIEIRRAND